MRARRLLSAGATGLAALAAMLAAAPAAQAGAPAGRAAGAVYVLGNEPAGNTVVAYARAADGTLTPAGRYPTGGQGTGAGLGSQNAVVVDDSGRHVYAVNAGSDSVSSFEVTRHGLRLTSVVPSGGDQPVSVGVRDDRLYVVNAGGDGTVSGFRVRAGRLDPLAGSTWPLSGPGAAPAQVSVTPDGRELVVTEKATQLIDVYRLDRAGRPTARTSVRSSGATPFGFGFTPAGRLAVSEAGPSAASTYEVQPYGLRTISASIGNTEAAACWLVVTDDGRFAYTGNGGGSQSVSGYRVARDGSLSLLTQDGKTGTAAAGLSDIALSRGSGFLYARLGDGTVGTYRVGRDGSLTALPVVAGLPAGAVGIAAR
jgi:6-phosphogluconolactonase